MTDAPLFRSFFSGGFECSTHKRRDGVRLDMVAKTKHDVHGTSDYRLLRDAGMLTVRDGLRWHLIERAPGDYDFSSVLPLLRAARDLGVQVVWDICHYGWPDDLDVFSPAFVRRFAALARAFTRLHVAETDAVPFLTPINEISFLAWAGGTMGFIHPFGVDRGDELKAQLARATIEGIEAIWDVTRAARICHVDPVYNVVPQIDRPGDASAAEATRQLQYQTWDMVSGRMHPHLGGRPEYLDVIGVNYYAYNQWTYVDERDVGAPIMRGDPRYRPFRDILREVGERYGCPMFLAETGTEGEGRPEWLRYVCDETRAAIDAGVPMHGICLYPVVNFPGWDDDRHCHNGLWDYADERGNREIYRPLAAELARQQPRFGDRAMSVRSTA